MSRIWSKKWIALLLQIRNVCWFTSVYNHSVCVSPLSMHDNRCEMRGFRKLPGKTDTTETLWSFYLQSCKSSRLYSGFAFLCSFFYWPFIHISNRQILYRRARFRYIICWKNNFNDFKGKNWGDEKRSLEEDSCRVRNERNESE